MAPDRHAQPVLALLAVVLFLMAATVTLIARAYIERRERALQRPTTADVKAAEQMKAAPVHIRNTGHTTPHR